MNETKELEALRRFRREVPAPNEEEIARARAVLDSKMLGPRTTTKLGALATIDRPRRRLRWALAGVAAAVAVALALPTLLPRGTRQAAAELRQLAAVAGEQPNLAPLGPGQYYYLKEQGLERMVVVARSGAYTAQYPLVREYWIGADGSGRLVDTPGDLTWPSRRDKSRAEADGSASGPVGPSDQTFGPGELVGPDLDGGILGTLPPGYSFDALPRDPKALYDAISAAAGEREGNGRSAEASSLGTFGLFIELLRTPLTPRDIRPALFEAMAHISGITVVDEQTIVGIGTGSAVSVDTHWGNVRVRLEFLVDPTTSELLGYRETQLDRGYWTDADPPFVLTSISYATPEVVESTAQRP